MKLTNNFNAPPELLAYALGKQRDPRERPQKRYGVTTLIHSPKEYELKKFYHDEMREDVKDLFWMIFGEAVHLVLEKGGEELLKHRESLKEYYPWLILDEEYPPLLEEKFEVSVDDCTLVGIVDMFRLTGKNKGVIIDYKTDTTYQADKPKELYEQQLNIYAWALRKEGYEVEGIEYVSFYKNWSGGRMGVEGSYDNDKFDILTPIRKKPKREFIEKANKNPEILDGFKYPLSPWRIFSSNSKHRSTKLELWSEEKQDAFVSERVALHKAYDLGKEHTEDSINSIPKCSDEDRWVQGEAWRIKRNGKKVAIRGGVHTSEREAVTHLNNIEKKEDLYIEYTQGEDNKCLKFCSVAKYCSYFKERYMAS